VQSGATTENLRAPRRVRAYLAATTGRPALLLASTEEEAERYARDARCFTGEPVVHLPSRGVLYGDVFGPPVTRVGERQRALHALPGARLVVAGPLAFAEKSPLYEPLRLEGGVELELDACLSRLVELGYERVDRVSRHGEFAVRGGIVDVFPSTRRSPVRVEWWGDEVESVRAVSLATQRVVRELASVVVYAAREGDLASLAATSGDDLPEEARQGVRVPGLDRLLLNLNPIRRASCCRRTSRCGRRSRARGLSEDADMWSGSYTISGCPSRTCACHDHGRGADGLGAAGGDAFQHDPRSGAADVRAGGRGIARVRRVRLRRRGTPDGLRVRGGRAPRVGGPFRGRDARARRLRAAGRGRGRFSFPEGGVAVVRRDTLFGRGRKRERQVGRSPAISSFADLKGGDLVVHQIQGIGRFEGLVSREVLGATRDYMQVSYRDGDTLFVPYEQMELLHKYVGGETARLDRLGGTSWAAVTDRVRGRVKALAGELLRVQAARAAAEGFAFPEDSEWERELEESFPYTETPDQAAAIAAVKADMQAPRPMDRLVCGDVGFGKTEVAVRAAFKAALAGKQVMLLAPTTILVQQHHKTFAERLDRFAVRVESLSRFSSAAERGEPCGTSPRGRWTCSSGRTPCSGRRSGRRIWAS
jgi:transcription-repair coupling factor (superfamily II helicase)